MGTHRTINMSTIQTLISEIKQEAKGTRKTLQNVPFDQLDWKPHEKSMKLKSLAIHIAQLAGWAGLIVQTDELDFAKNELPNPKVSSLEDLLKYFDEGVQQSVEALNATTEDDLKKEWTLRHGANVLMKLPKAAFIRTMAMNHLYHHRAQLGVYLRLLDIPVPGMYGPSADDRA